MNKITYLTQLCQIRNFLNILTYLRIIKHIFKKTNITHITIKKCFTVNYFNNCNKFFITEIVKSCFIVTKLVY